MTCGAVALVGTFLPWVRYITPPYSGSMTQDLYHIGAVDVTGRFFALGSGAPPPSFKAIVVVGIALLVVVGLLELLAPLGRRWIYVHALIIPGVVLVIWGAAVLWRSSWWLPGPSGNIQLSLPPSLTIGAATLALLSLLKYRGTTNDSATTKQGDSPVTSLKSPV